MLRTTALAMIVAAGCLPCDGAHAQVPLFLATCVAEAADLERLPLAFAKAGMVEIDPAAGPPGPGIAQLAPGHRLWSMPSVRRQGKPIHGRH